MSKSKNPPDQFQAMDELCRKWIGQEGVHGFDVHGRDGINCYLPNKNEKIERKIQAQAGEHKVSFIYGPPPTAEDLMRKGR